MEENSNAQISVTPIEHATMVLKIGDQVIYTDPVGGKDAFSGQPAPSVILVTDIHGDHFDPKTLKAVLTAETVLVAPQAVVDLLPEELPGTVALLKNGESTSQKGLTIQAMPMYNLPESDDAYHTKGRGNGYIIEAGGKRVYVSGDTADIPEMRELKDIDLAFVTMNLPYTMSVESAADAVLAFKPKAIHPYHYRGQDRTADIENFKELVNAGDPNINVELLDFYPQE